MTVSRRHFLTTSAAWAAATAFPNQRVASRVSAGAILVPSHGRWLDPDARALVAQAVEAAHAAGAAYADARVTVTREQRFYGPTPNIDRELYGIGVRAVVGGHWGFSASAVRTPEEMARLGRGAVAQAKASARGRPRDFQWVAIPPVVNGSWTTPIKYDPFNVPVGERMDFMNDAASYANTLMNSQRDLTTTRMWFWRQAKAFASTEGASWEQTTYLTSGAFSLGYRDQYAHGWHAGIAEADFLSMAGKGWEHISESGLVDRIPQLHDEAEQARHVVPVDIDRYDLVLSAQAMAAMIDTTIGSASELDRALGYEANATGTSYLRDPLQMLGTYVVGSPLLNVTADRLTPGAAATVRWDDESVASPAFPLVTEGILVDYQTTREQATWLAPYYAKAKKPVQSRGCAGAESGLAMTMQHSPNLRVLPGAHDTSFESLVSNTARGIAVMSVVYNQMDQQQLNGMCYATLRQIRNGKLGPFITNGAIVFRAPEFWKSLMAIGGPASERWYGFTRSKGEPAQFTTHSVGAVPGKVRNVRVIDLQRKAL